MGERRTENAKPVEEEEESISDAGHGNGAEGNRDGNRDGNREAADTRKRTRGAHALKRF